MVFIAVSRRGLLHEELTVQVDESLGWYEQMLTGARSRAHVTEEGRYVCPERETSSFPISYRSYQLPIPDSRSFPTQM